MASIFTKIMDGELPGRFLWQDEKCIVILTISPLAPGHSLVVPRQEVNNWLDLEPSLAAHLMTVAQSVGQGIQRAYHPKRVGVMIAGLEVPHVHLHLVPINQLADMDFAKQDRNPDPAKLDDAAAKLRSALRELGFKQVSD